MCILRVLYALQGGNLVLEQLLKLGWLMNKFQLLEVDFQESEGVLLEWNYSDVHHPVKFYRHFVVIATPSVDDANLFVIEFAKKVKAGQFYAFLYQTVKEGHQQTRWREQQIKRTKPAGLIYPADQIVTDQLQLTVKRIFRQFKDFSEPISISALADSVRTADKLTELVRRARMETQERPMLTVVAPYDMSELSVGQGLNRLSTEKRSVADLMSIFHLHLGQGSIDFATLTISCSNGTISSRCQEEWRNLSFNCIQRDYYGPSVKYQQDILHFINSKMDLVGSYELHFVLRFRVFQGQEYTSQKRLVINFNHTDTYLRSVGMPFRGKCFTGPSDLPLRDNPYKTETVVMFEKNVSEKGSGKV